MGIPVKELKDPLIAEMGQPGQLIWEFPKPRGTFLGVPVIRIIEVLGSVLVCPYLGKLPYTPEHYPP